MSTSPGYSTLPGALWQLKSTCAPGELPGSDVMQAGKLCKNGSFCGLFIPLDLKMQEKQLYYPRAVGTFIILLTHHS